MSGRVSRRLRSRRKKRLQIRRSGFSCRHPEPPGPTLYPERPALLLVTRIQLHNGGFDYCASGRGRQCDFTDDARDLCRVYGRVRCKDQRFYGAQYLFARGTIHRLALALL